MLYAKARFVRSWFVGGSNVIACEGSLYESFILWRLVAEARLAEARLVDATFVEACLVEACFEVHVVRRLTLFGRLIHEEARIVEAWI